MISDILDSPNPRSCTRTVSGSSTGVAGDEGSGNFRGYCDDSSSCRDSPRSVISDDADCKGRDERENREDSLGASDSDVERSGQAGEHIDH